MYNIMKLLFAPFFIYALLSGGLAYVLIFLIDRKLSPTPRNRAILYIGVLIAPLLTYVAYLFHIWRSCAGSYTEFYKRLCTFSIQYAGILAPVTALLLGGYLAYRGAVYFSSPMRKRIVSSNKEHYVRVQCAVDSLGGQALVEIWDNCYPSAFVRGYRRPQIVITSGLLDLLDDEELEGVIAHELAHVVSRDNYLNWVIVFKELTFFSPFAQAAYAAYSQAREEAADYRATSNTRERRLGLASALIKVTKRTQDLLRLTRPSFASSFFIGSQGVTRRIEILANEEAKYRLFSPIYPLALIVALALLIC